MASDILGEKVDYKSVFENWGIPDILESKEFGDMKQYATRGYGAGYVYNESLPKMREIASTAAQKRRETMYGLDTKFGGSFTLGAGGRLEGEMRANTASSLANVLMDAQSRNEQVRMRAQDSLLGVLMQNQGMIADVVGSYKSMQLQEDLTDKELKASGGTDISWIVGAEYGLTSIEEQLMQIWKGMQLRMARGKRWKLKFWRAVFTGYHRAAPWVVSQSMRSSSLLRMRKRLVDDFVRYVLCDIWRHRKFTVQERMAAAVMLAISLLGWRLRNG